MRLAGKSIEFSFKFHTIRHFNLYGNIFQPLSVILRLKSKPCAKADYMEQVLLNSLKGLHRVYQYIMQTPNNGHMQEFRSTNPWRAELNGRSRPDRQTLHFIAALLCYSRIVQGCTGQTTEGFGTLSDYTTADRYLWLLFAMFVNTK